MNFTEYSECFKHVILVACLTSLFVLPFVALLFKLYAEKTQAGS